MHDIFEKSVDFLAQHDVFYGHGVQLAEDEVVLLLMHVLEVEFDELNLMYSHSIKTNQVDQIYQLLNRRVKQKIPMVYLVGFAIFAGLRFKVDERVLIPRSPFVELIDAGFKPWIDLESPARVMDLCTGSGCIGLAIAHYFKHATVDLVDLSHEALQLAQVNNEVLSLSQRVQCIESDLFDEIERNPSSLYDLIVANPPYVGEDEYQDLPAEYGHEPKLALVSNLQGMELPVKILMQAPDYLKEGGFLFLEVGYNDVVLSDCFPQVCFEWLEFELGGQGICFFSRADLLKYRVAFKEFLELHVA